MVNNEIGSTRRPLSIVIEWENAGRIGAIRARRMLKQLLAQICDQDFAATDRPEILLMYNAALNTRQEVQSLVEEAGTEWPADIRYLPAIDGSYYEQKNHGADNTSGDVLIFLDSDVVPEPGWLSGLLSVMGKPGVDVVCGTTSIEAEGFYAKAFALFWFFPIRDARRDLAPSDRFYPNNVAFRRAVFDKHRFERTGQYRGPCALLADTLKREGYSIWRNHESHVLHPAPTGLRHFVLRALWHGHDDGVEQGRSGGRSFWKGTRHFLREVSGMARDIERRREEVGLGSLGAVGAAALGSAYFGIKYAGFLSTLAGPRLTHKLLSKAEL